MKIYILKAPDMPWDDYGEILLSGMTNHLDREQGLLQLERTGPFVPPISLPGINDIVVTENFKEQLEESGLTGFSFRPIIKRHIVQLNWENWDRFSDEPEEYPETVEPEDYILLKPHSPNLAKEIGNLWELVSKETADFEPYLGLTNLGEVDWFRARGIHYNFVSQKAKDWLQQNFSNWVSFKEALIK